MEAGRRHWQAMSPFGFEGMPVGLDSCNEMGGHLTAGGRVLSVVGRGGTLDDAVTTAYGAVAKIQFAGMQYRSDIGKGIA